MSASRFARSSRSLWSRGAINRAWAPRTIGICVEPCPITFAERRAVLQVLQREAPIEVFKRYLTEADKFIAVTKTTDAAERLIASSPKSYTVQTPTQPNPIFLDLKKSKHTPDPVISDTIISDPVESDSSSQRPEEATTFTITISPKNSQHADQGFYDPLQGSWPHQFTEFDTYTSSMLKQSLPSNMAATGLAHWGMLESVKRKDTHEQERMEARKWIPRHIRQDRLMFTRREDPLSDEDAPAGRESDLD
ncbi:uncharacterized protein F5Z01DRAFT_250594 [Emericellopsis atlantica]|uniref:Uncharacterized protein n=1 Tax=Emericellopsis atlantica TaxID=2614577 RepID=A0A9P7ZHC9_9HYPO|nr:uncharacterized protein F5Z01DRAFT_250594 [Emericellopsis atlantica]KAG9252114.1 hypothetical protein F5Z01DRAFT_250594 [Emericellopsis atlantica]